MYKTGLFILLGVIAICIPVWTAAIDLSKVRSTVEQAEFPETIPIDVWADKIFLSAAVEGENRRFILDSGSPTMLTKEVAEALNLEIIGQNQGQDANGNVVETDIAIVDRMEIGGMTVRNVPVFIFDPSNLELGHCLLDGGILGSEIMALVNWQIDVRGNRLIVTDDVGDLEHVRDAASAPMKVFGYPNYPVVEHGINGQFTDNALFDTGSSELLHLNERAYDHLRKEKILPKPISTAEGTFGTSAGGRGNDTTFYQAMLDELSIGELSLRDISAWTRPEVPTLIGAGIFRSHVVTLNYADSSIHFSPYDDPDPSTDGHGFRPYFRDGNVYVGFLERPSQAAESGLRLHDQIVAINERSLQGLDLPAQCDAMKWLHSLREESSLAVQILRGGKTLGIAIRD